MEKRLIPKSLVKKLQGKKREKTAENLEKRIKSSLLKHAQVFANEVKGIEKELVALPPQISKHWLWLGDVKRIGYLMDHILELLERTNIAEESTTQ